MVLKLNKPFLSFLFVLIMLVFRAGEVKRTQCVFVCVWCAVNSISKLCFQKKLWSGKSKQPQATVESWTSEVHSAQLPNHTDHTQCMTLCTLHVAGEYKTTTISQPPEKENWLKTHEYENNTSPNSHNIAKDGMIFCSALLRLAGRPTVLPCVAFVQLITAGKWNQLQRAKRRRYCWELSAVKTLAAGSNIYIYIYDQGQTELCLSRKRETGKQKRFRNCTNANIV